ncbi:MAG TPA: hypothetical protein DCW74_17245 [Alteromonas australica]|uniref:Uncharacterized protein n=1 Tax=Alteromonas australica TaxID=589873 RepID=A0A350P850_9ALTE|nr:hypothetical protein [Alteromonas australica]|tara:strand:+ start:380 stop:1018 length:639 start_codon:yes stop_codon:yes gene_type:complete
MAIATYTDLQTSIENFLARTDLTAQIPDFIQLAEARMSRELETRSQEKRATASTVAGNEYIALPTDLREVREVKLNTSPLTVLAYKSPTGIDEDHPTAGQSKPLSYTIIGDEIRLRPVPDAVYTVEIIYVGEITPLSATNATNTILSRHPDAYLSGALVEAYTYLMDESRAQLYDQKFSRAIAEIQKDSERAHYGTGSLQIQSIYQRQNSGV